MKTRKEASEKERPPGGEWKGAFSRRDLLRRAGVTAGTALLAGSGLGVRGELQAVPVLAAGPTGPGLGSGSIGPAAKPNVVLVHGAWADGSGWSEVIALLQGAGYTATAAAVGLASLADDVGRVQSVLALQNGPTVLVGHSIGGAVISGAGSGQSNVKALIYASAFAPDGGETIGQLLGGLGFATEPGTQFGTSLYADQQGYVYLTPQAYLSYFAPDVPAGVARIMATTQRPLNASYLGDVAGSAAWRTLPSWFLVSKIDQMVNPDLQRFEARRMNATTIEVESSHLSPVSHPVQVFGLIQQAAKVAMAA